MIRFILILGLLALSVCSAVAQESTQYGREEAAIRHLVVLYVNAFNRGDGKALAALWAEDGEYLGPSGETAKGRDKIEAILEKFFSENKGSQLEVDLSEIRITGPENAIEEGAALVSYPDGVSRESNYVVKYVKRGDDWKIARACETLSPTSNYEHLKELEWMIGEWVDQQEDSKVEILCEWSQNNNFITVSFTAKKSDCVTLEGTQVIGWDASTNKIKSWVFDSSGGFGEGVWTGKIPRWVVKTSGVLTNGEKISAVNTYTYVDENTFKFSSTNRKGSGKALPNIDEVKIVRKQPGQ
ncbi:MAG: SgcJ/EcaC family oxidoreductase [Deltaproteobacteria bacterium]|nr:SgcJ/EcaC family oxidoreductase [Deltaproteobacteria bacterium]